MNKAVMYLLLALGIIVGVSFVGGAFMGFAAGFIDGWNEAHPDTTTPVSLMTYSLTLIFLIDVVVLNFAFLHYRFASYGGDRTPSRLRSQVFGWLFLTMAGLSVFYALMIGLPYADGDTSEVIRLVGMMRQHPYLSIVGMAVVEATANLVIYGAALRSILEWKHRPETIIPIFAAMMAVVNGVVADPRLMIPGMMVALIEAWTYECTRSVLVVTLGDVFFWGIQIALFGMGISGWQWYLVAVVLILPSGFMLMRTMDRFRPIE